MGFQKPQKSLPLYKKYSSLSLKTLRAYLLTDTFIAKAVEVEIWRCKSNLNYIDQASEQCWGNLSVKSIHDPQDSHGDVRDNEDGGEEEEQGDDVLVLLGERLDPDDEALSHFSRSSAVAWWSLPRIHTGGAFTFFWLRQAWQKLWTFKYTRK